MEGPFEISPEMERKIERELSNEKYTHYMSFGAKEYLPYAIFSGYCYKMMVTNPYYLARCIKEIIKEMKEDNFINDAIVNFGIYAQSYDISVIEEYINGKSIDNIKRVIEMLDRYILKVTYGICDHNIKMDSLSKLLSTRIYIYIENNSPSVYSHGSKHVIPFISEKSKYYALITEVECKLIQGNILPSIPDLNSDETNSFLHQDDQDILDSLIANIPVEPPSLVSYMGASQRDVYHSMEEMKKSKTNKHTEETKKMQPFLPNEGEEHYKTSRDADKGALCIPADHAERKPDNIEYSVNEYKESTLIEETQTVIFAQNSTFKCIKCGRVTIKFGVEYVTNSLCYNCLNNHINTLVDTSKKPFRLRENLTYSQILPKLRKENYLVLDKKDYFNFQCAVCGKHGSHSIILVCKHFICNTCYFTNKLGATFACTFCKKQKIIVKSIPKYPSFCCNHCKGNIQTRYECQNNHIICFKCRTLAHNYFDKTDYCPVCESQTNYYLPGQCLKQVHTFCKCTEFVMSKRQDVCLTCNHEVYGLIHHLKTLDDDQIITSLKQKCTYCNIYSQISIILPFRCSHICFCNKCALLLRGKCPSLCCPVENCHAKRCNAFKLLLI